MNEENQKICKIVEEFSLYLLDRKINCLNVNIKKTKKRVSLVFICDKINNKMLVELIDIFKFKRQESIEMYGWELIGQSDDEHELSIVSSLINYFTYYICEGKVYFNLVRYGK